MVIVNEAVLSRVPAFSSLETGRIFYAKVWDHSGKKEECNCSELMNLMCERRVLIFSSHAIHW